MTKVSHIILPLILSRLLLALAMNPSSNSDPMTEECYLGDNVEDDDELFEGDIILTREQKIRMGLERSNDTMGWQFLNAIRNIAKKWQKFPIPVRFDESLTPYMLHTIHEAMSNFHEKTCVKFGNWTNQKDYIHIVKGNGFSSSSVGRLGGKQTVTLCEPIHPGVIIHELMHAIGFWHEHTRVDRDKYVTVFENNIKKNKLHNYRKRVMDEVDDLGFEYDQNSIMHYKGKEFAIDKSKPTMTAKNCGKLGQILKLTKTDIAKLNKFYHKCPTGHDELK